MKKLILILALNIFCFSKIYSTGWELEASYQNKPGTGIYRVFIQPAFINNMQTTVYDQQFNPVLHTPHTDSIIYNGIEADWIHFEAIYDGGGYFNPPGENGIVYYGIYYVEFREKNSDGSIKTILSGTTIDFRDGDYGSSGIYPHKDFFVRYDFNREGSKLHFTYYDYDQDYDSSGVNVGIWNLLNDQQQSAKPQNTSVFKNLFVGITNNNSADLFTVNIGAQSYTNCNYNWSASLAGGLSTTWIVDVPNRMDLAYQPTRTYEYFVAWSHASLT